MKNYLLWTLVFFAYASNHWESGKSQKTSLSHQDVQSNLSQDYQLLDGFGAIGAHHHISSEDFDKFFWKGVKESMNFYSLHRGSRSLVQNIVKEELFPHKDLKHDLKKPRLCKTNLQRAYDALHQFSGNWHGRWAGQTVNHLWLPVVLTDTLIEEKVRLVGFQSCYTGDGLGWNYIVENKEETLMLGYVYHFDEAVLTAENPHYAYCNTDLQLTWVSNDNIYYEFTCDDPYRPNEKQYVITGAKYSVSKKELKPSAGFQAVYSSKREATPVFQNLALNPLKKAKRSLASMLFGTIKKFLSF
ncbi:MAG: hypothetical protein AAGL34_18625 [Bacteroidota bacterium]